MHYRSNKMDMGFGELLVNILSHLKLLSWNRKEQKSSLEMKYGAFYSIVQ